MTLRMMRCYFTNASKLILLLTSLGTVSGYVTEQTAHPMLYFSQHDVPELRRQASFSHAKIAAQIEQATNAIRQDPDRYLPPENPKVFSSIWNEHFGNNLCMLSMYCVLHPSDEKMFQILSKYMDRMASYPDWYVEDSRGKDQVPIGHSLTGFATSYDFLYWRFNARQRDLYYKTIENTTADLYKLFEIGRVEWSKQYIHNHAPSNLVAFLLGSLVVSKHDEKLARDWLRKVQQHMDFAMELFSYVIDGSVDEGASYGSYTSRGITQYVYLAKRHFGVDHSNNPWLKKHFLFYYHTLLPGYQRTVGIGDTNYHWFYGPESQLHFLDSYIVNNGYGNWLADRIRSSRSAVKPLSQSTAQIWSTFHTEFLFYNSTLAPINPRGFKKMHVFSDWGVVTYGGGQEMQMGNTFLSLKSSVPNGEAVQDIIQSKRYSKWINGWKNFNAGHEHPDQNSFVFVPNGRYVVSESMYGPKFTHLDNTVVFAPSLTSKCNQPWEGQIGECHKWLVYRLYDQNIRGELISASTSGEMVFIAGEAARAYPKSLKLSSVFRATLLLNPEVLIVLDTIRLLDGSSTTTASFLFHNTWTKFRPHQHLGYKGAYVEYPEGRYTVVTIPPSYGLTNISLHEGVQPKGLREGPTNYINVTVPLGEKVTNVVHIFSGPTYQIKSVSMESVEALSGIVMSVKINDQTHDVRISNFVKSRSRLLEPYKERKRITGFGGFAQVKVTGRSSVNTHYFGLDKATYDNGHGPPKREYLSRRHLTQNDLDSMPKSVVYTTSFDRQNITEMSGELNENMEDVHSVSSEGASTINHQKNTIDKTLLLVQSIVFFVAVMVIVTKSRTAVANGKRNFRVLQPTWLMPCALALLTLLLNSSCLDENGRNTCIVYTRAPEPNTLANMNSYLRDLQLSIEQKGISTKLTIPTRPFLMLTSLPASGGYILGKAFEESNMTTYLPTKNLNIPMQQGSAQEIDLCVWNLQEREKTSDTIGWFNSIRMKPVLHFNQRANRARMPNIRQILRENLNAPIVMNDNQGFWTTKLPWMKSVIGKENFQAVIVVRDPRSWIYTMLKYHSQERSDFQLDDLVKHLDNIDEWCNRLGSSVPFYHTHFQRQRRNYDEVEKLAIMWTVTTGTALANLASNDDGSWPVHVIRFEDILKDPEHVTTEMFAKLGLPLSIRSLNKIVRTVKSGHYMSPHDGVIDASLLTSWKTGLSVTDVRKIEGICGGFFDILGYKMMSGSDNG